MIYLHLLWIVFLQPFILVALLIDKCYGCVSGYLYCTLTNPSVVEPCLYPPLYAVLIGIDSNLTLDIKGLNVDDKICKRIYYVLAGITKCIVRATTFIITY